MPEFTILCFHIVLEISETTLTLRAVMPKTCCSYVFCQLNAFLSLRYELIWKNLD